MKLFLFFFITGILAMLTSSADAKILYESDSLYHHIVVREEEPTGLRFLSFNRVRGNQSAVLPGHPEVLTFAYTKTCFAAFCFLERAPQRILYIGVGAGSIPAYTRLLYPKAMMDLVEIDQDVLRVAKEYFNFTPDEMMKEYVMDGRVFLRTSNDTYDFIFLDAYNDSSVPFHLTTKEFLQLAKEHLNKGGVLASNVWSYEMNRYFSAQINTYKEVFGNLQLFACRDSGNYIFVATKIPQALSKDILQRRTRNIPMPAGGPDLREIIIKEYMPTPTSNEDVLTDDFAPVNILRYVD
jgi:spermidine synthase